MLRALLVLLLLANALFYAWWQGWLAPLWPAPADPREPQRLASQLRPELVTVLSAPAAQAAVAAAASASPSAAAAASGASAGSASATLETPELPPVCLEAGPLGDEASVAALATLSQYGVPDGSVQREPVGSRTTWGVVVSRFTDRDALRAKADELKKLGLRSDVITSPPSIAPTLLLGNFSDKYGAEAALATAQQKGVRTGRVVALPAGSIQWWLRAPKADAELQTRLRGLPGERLASGFKPCAKRNGE